MLCRGPKVGSMQWIVLNELIKANAAAEGDTYPVLITELAQRSGSKNVPLIIDELSRRGNRIVADSLNEKPAYRLIRMMSFDFTSDSWPIGEWER